MAVLQALEREVVCSVPVDGPLLTSKGVRHKQTSMGALLTSTIRDCLQADVAMINGGTIKGNRDYNDGELNYLELQQELPFPTKMVVVRMPGNVLQDAISASRAGKPEEEKRGFLQTDDGVAIDEAQAHTVLSVGGRQFNKDAVYNVALPRNLLKGIFDIRPLVDFANAHPEAMANEDAYVPAVNLILMHQAKQIWRRLGDFDEIDLDGNQQLDRDEIATALEKRLGTKPSQILLDNVIRAIDTDHSGTIDRDEYEKREKAPLHSP
uniref:EF-hand domain-containing protein n=2 Tax=Chrysotila carterae TaxID=13221 RepID=A0A7S4BPL4_CHRCT